MMEKKSSISYKAINDYSYKEVNLVLSRNTPYINTIDPEDQAQSPGDQNLERKIRSLIRWNAAAMVVRANKNPNLVVTLVHFHLRQHYMMLEWIIFGEQKIISLVELSLFSRS